MAVKQYKPTTPSRRNMTSPSFDEVTKFSPEKSLIVLPEVNEFVIKSCANIEGVKTTQWNTINVYDILNCDTLIVAQSAVAKIEEVYAR